jgi:predicted RNA-binding Zn-ribbon protein involved in translation (DUF1610 family)
MDATISFACTGCKRRLRASIGYVGRSCPCPQCGRELIVPPQPPAEESSVLVMDDGHRLPRDPRRANF